MRSASFQKINYEANITFSEQLPRSEVRSKVSFVLEVIEFSGLLIGYAWWAACSQAGYRISPESYTRARIPTP